MLGETDVLVDALLRDEVNGAFSQLSHTVWFGSVSKNRFPTTEIRCKLTKPGLKLRRNRGELFVSGNIHINVGEVSPERPTPSASMRSEDEPQVHGGMCNF